MMVSSISTVTLAIIATIKITINPTDNVTATPIIGSRINITIAVTNAAIIIAPSINKILVKGLHTSLPLMIIRVFMVSFYCDNLTLNTPTSTELTETLCPA